MSHIQRRPDGFYGIFLTGDPGYTPIDPPPSGPLSAVAEWWRAVDKDTLVSEWHPSLQGGTEVPKPPGLGGSGVNIFPSRYSNFEEPSGLPIIYTNGCTVERLSPGFHGGYRLRITATADAGEVYFTPTLDIFNMKITPNTRWILSAYVATNRAEMPLVWLFNSCDQYGQLLLHEESAGITGPVGGEWVRKYGWLDWRSSNRVAAQFGVRLTTAGDYLDIDAIMLEEALGDVLMPSAYYAPVSLIDGEQIVEGSIAFSTAAEAPNFNTIPMGESLVWAPVAPETRLTRGKIVHSGVVNFRRDDAGRVSTFALKILREGELVSTMSVTALLEQQYVLLPFSYVDSSYDLAAIHYEYYLECLTEAMTWRGSAHLLEVRR